MASRLRCRGRLLRLFCAVVYADALEGDTFMKLFRWRIAALFAALLLATIVAFGQLTSGNITGTVFDPAGATVPNASVVVMNQETGVQNTTNTTSAGDYRFDNLPVGRYTLTVTAPGFDKAEVRNVNVTLNQTLTTNFNLIMGRATTTVQVQESSVAIDTTTAQLQTTYDTKQIADLPSASGGQAGSGVLNLSLLSAGVTSSGGAGYGMGPSVGGQRPTNNNFTIEGIDNNSLSVTGPLVTVPNDAVAEFSMLQNQFTPDFGHSSGGQFNQVVKSGTNDFHGMAFEYFENRNLDAADNLSYVEQTALHPRFDNNRFGGNFGGPIRRNKMFFFVDYEYNPIGETTPVAYYAPTAAGYATLASLPGINQTNLSEFQKYLGSAAVASDPATLPYGAPVLVAPGPGSVEGLGTGVFAPGASGAISIPAGLVSSSPAAFLNNEYGVASFDYNISDKDSLRARFILNRNGTLDQAGFPSVFYGVQPNNAYLITLSEYHTFTPAVVNELRLGFNRFYQNFPVFGNQSFPGLDEFPNINVHELNAAYGPNPGAPQFTIQNLYQLTDNVSWTKGNHSFKFGFDGWSSIAPSSFTQRSRGDYEYVYLSDYLYDYTPDYIAERGLGNVVYYANQQLLAGFANDIWKVTPHLTLNLGVRYEYLTVPLTENTQDLNASADVPGLITFRSPTTQKYNFMPRVGVAYSPGTSGRTSVRAGFGITRDVLYDNLGTLSLPPQLSTTVDDFNVGAPGFLAGGGILPSSGGAPPEGADARAATGGFIPDQKRPEAYNWNFGIQHEFGNGYVFESRYVGTRGLFLPVQLRLNDQPTVNASNTLPVYLSMPSQATLNSLTSTLGALVTAENNGAFFVPAYLNAGFQNFVTGFMPVGNSTYHGWSNQLTRRLSNGLQFQGSYTWSHAIDDATDTVDSTVLSPRRPQDAQDMAVEKASSLLDHRNRIVLEMLYDVPYFKNRNWFLKNVLGNWEIAPVYIFQTGEGVTAQSGVDSNLNEDSATDRTIINAMGSASAGSGVTALSNSAGDTVAYLATNPNARYIEAPEGTLPNGGRNTLYLNPINDVDVTLLKRFNISERFRLEFSARAFNVFNHPQYTGGYINDVAPVLNGGAGYANGDIQVTTLEPQSSVFQQWSQGFSSNPRQMQLSLKLIF
jgi:Carboxypeptidase regulatory-like domain